MVGWVLHLGFHKAAIKISAGLHSYLEVGLGNNPLLSSLMLLADLVSLLM